MKLIILIVSVFAGAFTLKRPLVYLPGLGKVEGGYKQTISNNTFYSFEGVPYAHPPVGKLRFKEPVSVKPWYGVWKAKTIYKCMQNFQYTPPGGDFVIGDEDCLYLNVYTPTLDPYANLDVLVYIHGGAFMFLHGGFQGPDYIMDKNLVYINLNYRLGPLGFLSTEDNILPGNNGLRDQIHALGFIKSNVKHFGGNPNSITLMGMSAGGASVHFHYFSPKSRGLFQRGISQSGTMLNPWVLVEQPLQKTKKLAASLGCPTKDSRIIVNCLSRRPARQIVAAVQEFQPWLYNPFSPFGVVVDKWAQDPILPDHPYTLLKRRNIADLPWIASYTNSEGLYPASDFYSHEDRLNDLDTRWNELLPFVLDYNYTVDGYLRDLVSRQIRNYYFGDRHVDRDSFMNLVRMISDRMFIVDIRKAIQLQAKATNSPVYAYYFNYRGAHSKSQRTGTTLNFGAAHGDDTSYVFKTNIDTTSTPKDRAMIEIMTDLVATFARDGQPKVPSVWPPVSKDEELALLKIGSSGELIVESSDLESANFWDSLPISENEKLVSGFKEQF